MNEMIEMLMNKKQLKEAIELLQEEINAAKTYVEISGNHNYNDLKNILKMIELKEMIIKKLDENFPKEPAIHEVIKNGDIMFSCPKCHSKYVHAVYELPLFCPDCGCSYDWTQLVTGH